MRRLGSCFSLCLLVLYVLCGRVSFSSRVPQNTQGPHYPTVIVYLEGRRKEEWKDQRKVCDRLLPVARGRPGLLSGSAFKNTLHSLRVCVCSCKLLMAFTWSAPDCPSRCHLILSEGYCFAILGRPSFTRRFEENDVMAQTRALVVIKNELPVITLLDYVVTQEHTSKLDREDEREEEMKEERVWEQGRSISKREKRKRNGKCFFCQKVKKKIPLNEFWWTAGFVMFVLFSDSIFMQKYFQCAVIKTCLKDCVQLFGYRQ